MNFKEVFETELKENNITWCKGECGEKGHKRGFVLFEDRTTVHLDRGIATRSTLHRALHELGHCLDEEFGKNRSFKREQIAEDFANKKMKELGIRIPRKVRASGVAYVKRKKRHGDNIKKSKN